ncbi:vWA domain-containing protein [Pseudomonas typographi]|uniref:vWA domain-containing protein n=1 Tax=Pseudomonas typographi TaxID=2715964 RepID=UPI0016895BFD|nr:VWA domain-containing protein [Pseudomonas typographi]MBD1587261.1 VWA domain-containing protein [Pseudomonas typographi]
MFEFAWPWLFAVLPLPWVLRALLPVADSGEPVLKVAFIDELERSSGRRARLNLPGWRQQWPLLLVWLLLLLAAARPQWLGAPLPIPASGRDLLVAVDVSGSMDYPDMQWQGEHISRLAMVKQLLGDFLEAREGDRLGLILFGSRPYLQAPLTFDRHTVRTWLDEAHIGVAGNHTAIGDAIGLGLKRLGDRPAQSRVMILVTDGANNGGLVPPATAARLAAQQHVRIYTIGIGAPPGSDGQLALNPSQDLDEAALGEIATLTGGRYFRAHDGGELQAIGSTLDRLEPVQQQPTRARPVRELYPWPLGVALLLSALLTVRQPLRSLWQRSLDRASQHLPVVPRWREQLKWRRRG